MTTRVAFCPRCGVLLHTMMIRCTNCQANFKYFGAVQCEQFTFGEENSLRPPEAFPKRMPRRPSAASPAQPAAGVGAQAPEPVTGPAAPVQGGDPEDNVVIDALRNMDPEAVREFRRQADMLASLTQFQQNDVASYRANIWARLKEGIKQYRRWQGTWPGNKGIDTLKKP